jgi:hypothetical protein
VNYVTYCGVGPPLQDLTRYHCPIIGFLDIPKISQKPSKRKIWLYDRGDFLCSSFDFLTKLVTLFLIRLNLF